ncbi:steroid receptor RNA activator 1 [Parasteatoda tepidariorum]|nr:uncharacterized protein LOC107450109 [Parasteatoda tepidariorum]
MNPSVSDRSWNDPPVVKYEITNTAKKHHLLNKRVVENETKHQASASSNKIELSDSECKSYISDISEKEFPVACEDNETSENLVKRSETLPLSDEETLSYVVRTLQKILDETADKSEKTTKDVNKRIDIMKDFWNSKLSKEVKNKMFELAQELEKGNIDAALKIQWSLMMENVREVKSWMVGVKHIIEMKKEKTVPDKLQNIDSSSCL